ncbi:uncharacterized protein LOC101222308 isoform X2 [Cucumis sativus]|uniref:uncharacterized protein LOC101222308 isoform X2 n=1 Tax=Cucumis sativus TaxID=3659 RepID=UPI0012F4F05B|nr:uncharacterized protein LOC101222308 isoform X2 [Cucumis sativus]
MVMAESLDDNEFWLPPQFLADDDNMLHQNDQNCCLDESLEGSSETLRDEEDSVSGLILRMPRFTIDDILVLSGSPQSTLCDMESGSSCSQVSSRGSPKANSKAQSPPPSRDLLHAVAEEVARMRINESHGGFLHQNRGTSQVFVPVKNPTTGTGFYLKLHGPQNLTVDEQINSHEMVQNGMSDYNRLSSSAWLPPPQGSRTEGGKREIAGTGVFLPRHSNAEAEERRKQPACSTVLVPAKVMKALNLKLDDICNNPHFEPVDGGRFNSDNDVLLRMQTNHGGNYQKRNTRREPSTDQEIKLPQEWIY